MFAEVDSPLRLARPGRLSVTWDRSRGAKGLTAPDLAPPASDRTTPTCLWTAGFVANRSELRRQLAVSASASDEELLTVLVERYGADVAAAKIAGPFSWLIWLPESERLVAVCDRQGAHSLYLSERGAEVSFGASRSDLEGAAAAAELDSLAAAGHLLGSGPPPGHSFFRGLVAVEPGEQVSVCSRRVVRRAYWCLEPCRLARSSSDEDHAERLLELLLEVVAGYCPAERFGVTLSGGMDSTSVAAALRAVAPEQSAVAVRWIAPGLPSSDESELSGAVARRLGMATTEVRADLHWPLSLGCPAGTPEGPEITCYPDLWKATFRSARAAGLGALFTGSSGDNLFGGMVSSYPDLLLTFRWIGLLKQLRRHLPHSRLGLAGIVRRLVMAPIRSAWLGRGRLRPPTWLTAEARVAALDAAAKTPGPPFLRLPGRRQHLSQLVERLPALVGRQLTLQAAEHGVELRQPLRDHRLIDFAATLPPDQIFRAGQWKFVLRNAMAGRLPGEVLSLRRKIVPDSIFRRGLWERERDRVRDLFVDMRAADLGLVEPATLRAAYERYFEGPGGDSRFWQALTLESWLRRHW